MHYEFVKEAQDYSDFASGRVFHGFPGHPAFPVRLASEIFQRCMALRARMQPNPTPCRLYDPCCGAGYHLSVLAFLHGESLREVMASDIDEKAVELARRNLALASSVGLEQRISEIAKMAALYGKESHREALRSAQNLKNKFSASYQEHPIRTKVFQASAFDGKKMLKNIDGGPVDIVFTDIPYGQHSQWNSNGSSDPLWSMLEALRVLLSPASIVAIASNKQQKATHERYQRLEQFQIGKRRVAFLNLITH